MFQGKQCVIHGADHVKENKICQDAAKVCEAEHFSVAAVSDGHGGTKYIRSDVGSKLAVETAVETVCKFMEDFDGFTGAIEENSEYVLQKMERYFISGWNEKIEKHYKDHELTEDEKAILNPLQEKEEKEIEWQSFYGCTVLIAVLAEGYCYGMLVGDGTFAVVYEDGTVSIPIEDPYSVANMTSSVCSKQCIDTFQHFYEKKQPLSMTVSSDGLCKSFESMDSLKDYHIRLTYMMNTEQFLTSLEKNLQNFTEKGSGDDISVATVFDSEQIEEQKEVLLKRIEEGEALEQQHKKERELKKLQAEQERAARELEMERAETEGAQKKLEQGEAELEEKQKKLNEKEAELEEKQKKLNEKETELEEKQKKLNEKQIKLEQKEEKLLEKEDRLRRQAKRLQQVQQCRKEMLQVIEKHWIIR